jgi:hypothetical protein
MEKFEMGLGKFSDKNEEHFADEEAIAFKYFLDSEEHDLFEGEEYIWRSFTFRHAMACMPPEMQPALAAESEASTLQNISAFAEEQFDLLKQRGIRFDGRFIVHNVNGATALVLAVPKIKWVYPEDLPHPAMEWEYYVSKFLELQKNLISYYDTQTARETFVLYDVSRFPQYVYGKESGEAQPSFILVDGDPRFAEVKEEGYAHFIRGGKTAIEDFKYTLHRSPYLHEKSILNSLADLELQWDQRSLRTGMKGGSGGLV